MVTDLDPPATDSGTIDFTLGAATMVRQVVHEPEPTESVTVTVAAPTAASDPTLALAVMVVELTTLTDEKLIPATLAVAPVRNAVPVMVTPMLDAPWPRGVGEKLVTVTVGVEDGYSCAQPCAGTVVPSTVIGDDVVL